jgi:midasin (ATPase involved in ribosome maturation)
MDVSSDHVKVVEKMYTEVKSDEELIDFELEVKQEKSDEKGNIKTEVFEKENYPEPFQIIGEKRKNQERSDLKNENKKVKEKFVVFEESDYKQEAQEIAEINLGGSNNHEVTFRRTYQKCSGFTLFLLTKLNFRAKQII